MERTQFVYDAAQLGSMGVWRCGQKPGSDLKSGSVT